ncbi:hypothetical protein GL279_02805 [Paracoccus limosus]|jgi:hypothetical protein|uniref:Uncharacterized protein n=1 Tax=Paracoccus limosus TaxID=913252 RepID=A0A844H0H9_9RHOB|nr:hypothetical protein [Paracoccus limosus]MTH33525.1 hypothetical protein [Paracoccus limosus]
MKSRHLAGILALALAGAAPALAQTTPTPATSTPGPQPAATECPPAAAQAQPATPEVAGADATAPSNSGSTGWTGGAGGSHIGTTPSGAGTQTRTWQPPTARGLDLAGSPEPAPPC